MYSQSSTHSVKEISEKSIIYKNGKYRINNGSSVQKNKGFLIIYMSGCPPCINKAPLIKELSIKFKDINFYALEGVINPIGQSLIDQGFPTIRYVSSDGEILMNQAIQITKTGDSLKIQSL